MKQKRKSKDHRILEAFQSLEKAIKMEDPDIQIKLCGYGPTDEEKNREFGRKIKAFVEEYKKFYGIKKVNVELSID